jgi:hypothetical protein
MSPTCTPNETHFVTRIYAARGDQACQPMFVSSVCFAQDDSLNLSHTGQRYQVQPGAEELPSQPDIPPPQLASDVAAAREDDRPYPQIPPSSAAAAAQAEAAALAAAATAPTTSGTLPSQPGPCYVQIAALVVWALPRSAGHWHAVLCCAQTYQLCCFSSLLLFRPSPWVHTFLVIGGLLDAPCAVLR